MHHKRNRPDHRINFWARIPVYTQTKVTSEKSQKRTKRKKESIRAGALLPDVIRLNNHVKHSSLSRNNFESNCQKLSQVCNKEEICDTHLSLYNLKQISSSFRFILGRPLETIPDWKRYKRVHSRNFGYLNSAINNPEIKQEIELVSELVDKFNKIKENLEEYKEDIASRIPPPSNPLRQQAPGKPEPGRFWKLTQQHKQKTEKCTKMRNSNQGKWGYSNKQFEAISLQAFYSPAIREAMTVWEEYGAFQIDETTLEAVNNLKNHYPRIGTWKPSKILQQISTNWNKRDTLQNQLNKEKLKMMKHHDLKNRLEENPDNKFTSKRIINDEMMEELMRETELNWSKAAELTRYGSKAPPIITDNIVESENIGANAATLRANSQ